MRHSGTGAGNPPARQDRGRGRDMLDARDTRIGGHRKSFPRTVWAQIESLPTQDASAKRRLLDTLIANYWKPVYCYLRREGHSNETAKDLTQGFFEEVVLERRLFETAERGRGRLRNLILTALKNFVANWVRDGKRMKRRPPDGLVSLDDFVPGHDFLEPSADLTPGQAFYQARAAAILYQAIEQARQQLCADGKRTHWKVFEARVLEPIRDGCEPVPLSALCATYGIGSAKQASNMRVTVERRIRSAMRGIIRPFVDSEEQVDEEIRQITASLTAAKPS